MFEGFHVGIDLVELGRDVDCLRAMGNATPASDAVVGLTQLLHLTVIPDKKSPACPRIILGVRTT